MNLMLKLAEANPVFDPRKLRLDQRKRQWLDCSITAPTRNIVV